MTDYQVAPPEPITAPTTPLTPMSSGSTSNNIDCDNNNTPRSKLFASMEEEEEQLKESKNKRLDLTKLNWSFTQLYDNEETRNLFEEFLRSATGLAPFKFVENVNEFLLLRSHANRYRKATEIMNQFIQDNCQYDLHLPRQARDKYIEEFEQCTANNCPKTIFDTLYEQKFIELHLDGFRRFCRSESFISFMERKYKTMSYKDFINMYVEKNVEGSIYMSNKKIKTYATRTQPEQDQEEAEDNDSAIPPPPPTCTVKRSIEWQQSELPDGIQMEQMDVMIQSLMHPKTGVPLIAQPLSTKEKILNAIRPKSKRIVSSGDRKVFTGRSLIDQMCQFFGLDTTQVECREKMIALANILIQKLVIAPSNPAKKVINQRSSLSRDRLLDSKCLSRKDMKRIVVSFKDSSKAHYLFLIKKKLLIAGGGFGGISAARELSSHFDITIIDGRPKWEYNISFHHLVGKPERLDELQFPILDVVHHKCGYIQGKVKHVMETAVQVENTTTGEIQTVPFDYLIVSTGSSYRSPFPIMKMEQEKNATIVYPYLSSSIVHSQEEFKKANTIVVIGGGPVAIEMVGEVCHFAKPGQQVYLISQCDVLLERLCEDAHNSTFAALAKYKNLKFLFNRRVTKIVGNTIEYCFNEENQEHLSLGELQADLVYCCVGFRPNTDCLRTYMPQSLSDKGYVKVNPETLQIQKSNIAPVNWDRKLQVDQDPNSFALKPVKSDTVLVTEDSSGVVDTTEETCLPGENFEDSAQVAEVMPVVVDLFTRPQTPEELYDQFDPAKTEYYDNIFAIGDIIYSVEEKLAYVARNQANALANIIKSVESNEPVNPYKPLGYRLQVITIGPKQAIAVKGTRLIAKGYLVIKLKAFFEYNFMREMKPTTV